jgi:DNA polymerase-3 subunit delta
MKLSVAKAGAFVERPDKNLRLFLLYGPDSGLVRERGAILLKHFAKDVSDPFAVQELEADALHGDAARLHDEMASIPMLGGRRVVRIVEAGDALFSALDKVLGDLPKGDSVAIIEAGELDKRSRLRLRIEDDPVSMAIPCYPEEGPALDKTITDLLKTHGFTPERDALQALVALLPPDRRGVRMEVDKLATYAHGKNPPRITLDDVRAVCGDAGAQETDEAVEAAASGARAQLDHCLTRLTAENTPAVQILRASQRHFLRLYEAASLMREEEMSAAEALKRLRPPVFFKKEALMTRQLQRWKPKQIMAALALLIKAETRAKSSGLPSDRLAEKALRDIADFSAR